MITVFGSLNVDLLFDVADLPTPGRTRLADTMRIEPGGKGANQALAARRVGADVTMVGATGRDAFAEIALRNLHGHGVDVSRVAALDVATGCASISRDRQGENQIVVALGANALATASQIDDDLLERTQWLLLQGESETRELEAVIARAPRSGARVLLNLAPPVPLSDDALRAVDLLVVNEDEASTLASRLQCKSTAAGLFAELGIDVIRTLGSVGAEAATLDGVFHVAAEKITPLDTTGAGDCFVGALAAALDRDEPLVLAVRAGVKAATACCLVRGAQG